VSAQAREGENIGGIRLQAICTPDHTDESFSLLLDPARPKRCSPAMCC
jgi:hypothetical protein